MTVQEHSVIPGITIEEIAAAILDYDVLRVRDLAQEWVRYDMPFAEVPRPETSDARVLAVAAAVVELLAQRVHQTSPAWTAVIGGLPEPFFVMRILPYEAYTRYLCLTESPEPLRKRNIFAPPDYLTFA